jgi:hypothetical protein
MVSLKLLIQLDYRLKEIFENDRPFGGISVIFFGDLHQLAPGQFSFC